MLPGSSTILNGSVLSPFNAKYRPEILNTANIVFVRMACCPEAGAVTQEQIDRACSGQISCPHCGRWNSFTILERGSVPGTYPFDSEHTSVEHMEHMTKKEADTNDADSPWEEDDEL